MTRRGFVRSMSALPIAVGLMATLAFGAYFLSQELGRSMFGTPGHNGASNLGQPNPTRDLIEQHGCWSGGPAPADMEGKMPSHVVMRYADEKRAHYRGGRHVEVALAHIFTQPNDRVGDVFAFCR